MFLFDRKTSQNCYEQATFYHLRLVTVVTSCLIFDENALRWGMVAQRFQRATLELLWQSTDAIRLFFKALKRSVLVLQRDMLVVISNCANPFVAMIVVCWCRKKKLALPPIYRMLIYSLGQHIFCTCFWQTRHVRPRYDTIEKKYGTYHFDSISFATNVLSYSFVSLTFSQVLILYHLKESQRIDLMSSIWNPARLRKMNSWTRGM